MELLDYVRMAARRWRWVVGSVLLALLAGLAFATTRPTVYTATAQLFVGTGVTPADGVAVNQAASQFALDRMDSYAALSDTPEITQGIRQQLGITSSDEMLNEQLTVTVVPKTVLLSVQATDERADQAAQIANAASSLLGTTIGRLESPTTGGQTPVRVRVVRPAATPSTPSSPNRMQIVLLALVAGLGVGLVAASLRDQSVRRERASEFLESDVSIRPVS